MVQKSFEDFKLVCRYRIGSKLGRLVSFTLSNCGISFQEFADRVGVKPSSITRIIQGKFSPRVETVLWIEYIAELFNIESASTAIPPSGVVDDLPF